MKFENIRDLMGYMSGSAKVESYNAHMSLNCVGKMEANLSSEYSAAIKEAARCNRWASDVIYDIQRMNKAIEEFDPAMFPSDGSDDAALPVIVMGFRKDGVDGNEFIVSRCEGECYNIYRNYFALIFMEVKRGDWYEGDWCVETSVYHV